MERALLKQLCTIRETLRGNTVLRGLVIGSIPVVLLGYSLGGLRMASLLVGYMQLVFRTAISGEPVENAPVQRAAALAGGLSRMLFFTGMMTRLAVPLTLLAVAQAAGLLLLLCGERSGTEVSLLPLMASSAFLLAGLALGVGLPEVWIPLTAALILTLLYLLTHAKRNWNQLRMRFHLA